MTVKEVWCVTKSMKEFHSRYFNPRLRKMKFGDTQLEWENWWGSHSLICAKASAALKRASILRVALKSHSLKTFEQNIYSCKFK